MRKTLLLLLIAAACGRAADETRTTEDALRGIAPEAQWVPLSTWFNPYTNDFYTGTLDTPLAGYSLVRVEGRILSPALTAVPSGLVPLRTYFNPITGDRITTTDTTHRPDYYFDRNEGWVFSSALAGTGPLRQWYSAERNDYLATNLPDLSDLPAASYAQAAVEGHILPAPKNPQPFGWKHRDTSRAAPHDVIVIAIQYRDQPLRHSTGYIRGRLFSDTKNVSDYFTTISGGTLSIVDAGVLGPYTMVDDPTTPDQDESLFAEWPSDGTVTPTRIRAAAVKLAAADIPFDTLDEDGDGVLESDEVVILVFAAGPLLSNGAQRKFQTVSLNEKESVSTELISTNEDVGLMTIAHELLHSTTGANDLYGGGGLLSMQLSPMANTTTATADETRTFWIDPWHAMAHGWVEPQVRSLSDAGGCRAMGASSLGEDPTLLWDPERGTDEMLLVEYRSRTSGSLYDLNAGATRGPARGAAVWYADTPGGEPYEATGIIQRTGPNLVTTPLGDDFAGSDAILPGANDVLETMATGTDDPGNDPSVHTLGFGDLARGDNSLKAGNFSVRWPGVGTRPTIDFTLGGATDTTADLEWRLDGTRLTPRIETLAVSVRPGEAFGLDGEFGAVRDGRDVFMTGASPAYPTIEEYACESLLIRIPEDTPYGAYELRVGTGSNLSNGVFVWVQDDGPTILIGQPTPIPRGSVPPSWDGPQ